MKRLVAAASIVGVLIAGCGGSDSADSPDSSGSAESADAGDASDSGPGGDAAPGAPAGITVVSPDDAAAIIDDAPEDLVILDVRTPAEAAEARIEGSILIDFYEPDFGERLAELDPDATYVLYCRSGNRSGQAREQMDDLGFETVADVDGGIVGWLDAGLPTVSG